MDARIREGMWESDGERGADSEETVAGKHALLFDSWKFIYLAGSVLRMFDKEEIVAFWWSRLGSRPSNNCSFWSNTNTMWKRERYANCIPVYYSTAGSCFYIFWPSFPCRRSETTLLKQSPTRSVKPGKHLTSAVMENTRSSLKMSWKSPEKLSRQKSGKPLLNLNLKGLEYLFWDIESSVRLIHSKLKLWRVGGP